MAGGGPARAGRPADPDADAAPGFPEYERPGRFAATDESNDDDFLRKVREQAEQQRSRYEAEKKRKQEGGDTA